MRKIEIIGGPGAGKTTLATAMGEVLGLAVVHLDDLFWISQDQVTARSECQARLDAVLQREAYIIEGGHDWSFQQRAAACDTLIWLDIPPHIRAMNIVRRRLGKYTARHKHATGIAAFQAAKPVFGHWHYFALDWAETYSGRAFQRASTLQNVQLIRLRSRAEVAGFLTSLRK
ncbi:MAG: hypothetical protein JNK19_03605 [Tabrizicola sp.]|nr:hypothetical protein [Tabrizicola sp.]